MKLTDEEKATLDGREGEVMQRAMEVLVRYGDAMGADRLLDVDNVAFAVCSPFPAGRVGGVKTVEESFARMNLASEKIFPDVPRVRANTCQLGVNVPEDYVRWCNADPGIIQDSKLTDAFIASKGIFNMQTCAPYLTGQVPVFGEHCVWGESSAVIYINSVIGARTNCEGILAGGCSALVKKTPNMGLHIDSNRRATHLVKVEAIPQTIADWDLLGFYIGQVVETGVPALEVNVPLVSADVHKNFGAALATEGGIDMYHIIGHTPEARTYEEAFGGNKPADVIVYGQNERKKALDHLDFAKSKDVDLVVLGCPHASIAQLHYLAEQVRGKKLRAKLIVCTAFMIKELAKRDEILSVLEEAGVFVLTDCCPAGVSLWPQGVHTMATDSAKYAHYAAGNRPDFNIHMGDTDACIEAAISGKWGD